jgi:hypothetical protein
MGPSKVGVRHRKKGEGVRAVATRTTAASLPMMGITGMVAGPRRNDLATALTQVVTGNLQQEPWTSTATAAGKGRNTSSAIMKPRNCTGGTIWSVSETTRLGITKERENAMDEKGERGRERKQVVEERERMSSVMGEPEGDEIVNVMRTLPNIGERTERLKGGGCTEQVVKEAKVLQDIGCNRVTL